MRNLDCQCVACAMRAIGTVDDDDELQWRLLDTLHAAGRCEEDIDALEWWMERRGVPIDLLDIPQPHEQLFWDVVALRMANHDKYIYHADKCAITLGEGKLVVNANGQQREYVCVDQLRNDYESGDPIAREGVRLAEQLVFYLYADRQQYECLCTTDLKLRVEIDYEEEVAYVEQIGEIHEIHRYAIDEFISLIGSNPLVTEAVALLEDAYPDLDWRGERFDEN